jgi:hypothetical protein
MLNFGLTISKILPALLIAAVSLLCSSCSKTPRPTLCQVHGQVFFEGMPAAQALVIFHPLNDPDPHRIKPRAMVDTKGAFNVYTYDTNDGAPPGEYAVTVQWKKPHTGSREKAKRDRSGGTNSRQQASKPKTKNRNQKTLQPTAPRKAEEVFPSRYLDPATSGLRVQVQEGSNELPPFQLKR